LWLGPASAQAQSNTEGAAQDSVARPAAEASGDLLEEARALAAAGDIEAAAAKLDAVAAGDAAETLKVQARYLKGMVLLGAGDELGARNSFQSLIDDYPQIPEPYNNLAAIYAADGDLERARDLLLELLRRQPDYAVGYENLGDLYAKLAADAYNRARALSEEPGRLPQKLELLGRLFEPAS
jgi:Flp pilus assembly protein TadD